MIQEIFGDITVMQDVFKKSGDLLEEIRELIQYQHIPFLDAIEHVASAHNVDVEQLVPVLKRSKALWARMQSDAIALRLIKAPKTRGPRTRKSAPAKESLETLE